MRLNGRDMRTIRVDDDGRRVHVIDQTQLPHRVETRVLADCAAAETAMAEAEVSPLRL